MKSICVFGVFVADLCFIGEKIPEVGQTILGTKHLIGPGGKGSNQAIAAARLGGNISFITKIGDDNNAEMALNLYKSSQNNTCIFETARGFKLDIPNIGVHRFSVLELFI